MKWNILTALILLSINGVFAQSLSPENIEKKCFVGSTAFMLLNLVDDPEPPSYVQLNFGYRLTPKDVISLELITWKYYEPLGVPIADKKEAPNFPGYVQVAGAGLAYKRFLWKRVYAQFHATAFHKNYFNEVGEKIQSGFQLFNTLRVGYQFRFFKNRLFLEPSVAMTFWPINTNVPMSFQSENDKWNGYLLGEPGLHFGFNF